MRIRHTIPAMLLLASALAAQERDSTKSSVSDPSGVALEAVLTDGGKLKLYVLEEKLEIRTEHGTLSVPVADVQQLTCATRITAKMQREIDQAVLDLGSKRFTLRQTATEKLLLFGEKSLPAVQKALRHTDAEIARRAAMIFDKLRLRVPKELLLGREDDVIVTAKSTYTGHLLRDSLKVRTMPFGEQELHLASVDRLSFPGKDKVIVKNASPDPGNLSEYRNRIGETFYFKVKGSANGSLWGTDIYTSDSSLATAAVHAGILKEGEEGVVKVTMAPSPAGFVATTRNGVTSHSWGVYPAAYTVSKE